MVDCAVCRYPHAFSDAMVLNVVLLALGCVLSLFPPNETRVACLYVKRAHSHMVEVAGASHSVYASHPKEGADVIESAARAVSK
jgi:hypothetical protein